MFDAGAVSASLTLDPSQFDRVLADRQAKVKAFEAERHTVKLSAVFDTSSISRARQQFAQLDNQISKDAMSRLRSSPQGSVLGALNALFSPHPVTGAPSPQQAAQGGLLGKMISSPGGGGSPGGTSGGTGSTLGSILGQNASTTDNVRQNVTGQGPQNVTTTDAIKQMITGQAPGNVTTTDTIKQDVTGKGPSDTTTTDTVKEKIDPASAAKAEGDARASGDRAGGGWFQAFTGHLRNLLPSSSADKAVKDAGAAGDRGGAALGSGLLGGMGPGILGISTKISGIVGLVGSALAVLPALAGIAGVGLGAALIGGMVAGAVAGSAELKTQFKNIGGEAKTMFAAAAAPIIPALHDVLAQVPALIKQLQAPLTGIFKTIAPQMQGIFAGLVPIITGLVKVMQAAAPAFGPFIEAIEGLVANILPGLQTVIKATVPFISQFAGIMKTLGGSLGSLFAAAAPAIGASMKILGGLLGLVGDLLPPIMSIAGIFAKTLAPVFTAFASVIGTLTPVLTLVGQVIAQFAGAVLGDLGSAFGAVASLIKAIGPGLQILATTLGSVFNVLENSGVFAELGDALENIATPLGNLIGLLIKQLAPILPPIITLIGDFAGIVVTLVSAGLGVLINAVSSVLKTFPFLVPLIGAVAAATWLWNLALDANPIGAVIIGIVALIGGIDLLVTHWSTVWGTIKQVAGDVGTFLDNLFHNTIVQDILAIWSLGLVPLAEHWSTVWAAIKAVAVGIWDYLVTFGDNMDTLFTHTIPGYWDAAYNAIVSTGTSVVNWFKGLPASIMGALASLGSDMLGFGKDVLNQFLAGAESIGTTIVNFFKGLGGDIVSAFKAVLSIFSPSGVFYDLGVNLMEGLKNGIEGKVNSVVAASKAAASSVAGAASGPVVDLMKSMAAARGWTGAQWAALNSVVMAESGYSLTATNPTSGAYGLAQFIGGPSEYATYGGNATTASGQITAMLSYIAQRYGTPEAAAAHEAAFHWYGSGGMITEPVIGRGMNSGDRYVLGESGSEMVTPVGGSHGGTSMDDLAALLRELNGHMRQQIAVTRQIPAGVGDSVGGAIGGAAHAASFRSRYPRGGSS